MRRGGALAALLAAVVLASLSPTPERPAVAQARRPNIIVIVTDDQAFNTMWVMPKTRRLIARHGITFRNGFAVNPQCCPSRATLLTGQHSHRTKIYKNHPPFGGFVNFRDRSTMATWLNRRGYNTALIGKYMNGYLQKHARYVPPGWDRWVGLIQREKHQRYYRFKTSVDGRLVRYGKGPSQYITDVLSTYATQFVRNTRSPFFLYFNPNAPHPPSTAAPRHENRFRALRPRHRKSFNERDVRDKPRWVRRLPRLGPAGIRTMNLTRERHLRSLLALDDAVANLFRALRRTQRLRNTFILFLSDNGYMFGEHRWDRKQAAYEESTRIPFMVRYDPITRRSRRFDRHLVANLDVAPTVADLANVPAPNVEGRSLLPLLRNPRAPWRQDLLLEHVFEKSGPPTYCGVRTRRYVYIRYETDEEELYDLSRDPAQLRNRANDPLMAGVKAQLRLRLSQLCTPPPPGMSPL